MNQNTILEAVKIQARIVIPIVHALEKELGKPRAHQIVGDAIATSYAEFRCRDSSEHNSHPSSSGLGFPIETTVKRSDEDNFAFHVTRCEFANYFRDIGEGEIGSLMTCGVDFATEELLRPSWLFSRSQTRMEGAEHCDFSWQRKSDQVDDEGKNDD